MQPDADTEWPSKLIPSLLAANTQTKRSTSYESFRLMLGRDYNPIPFLKAGNNSQEIIQKYESADIST